MDGTAANQCPQCKVPLAEGAVLCTQCGYHLGKGQRLTTSEDVQAAPAAPAGASGFPRRQLVGRIAVLVALIVAAALVDHWRTSRAAARRAAAAQTGAVAQTPGAATVAPGPSTPPAAVAAVAPAGAAAVEPAAAASAPAAPATPYVEFPTAPERLLFLERLAFWEQFGEKAPIEQVREWLPQCPYWRHSREALPELSEAYDWALRDGLVKAACRSLPAGPFTPEFWLDAEHPERGLQALGLARQGRREIVPSLLACVQNPLPASDPRCQKDPGAPVRAAYYAMEALAILGEESASAPALAAYGYFRKSTMTGTHVMGAYFGALGHVCHPHPEGIAELIGGLQDPMERYMALDALILTRHPDVPKLADKLWQEKHISLLQRYAVQAAVGSADGVKGALQAYWDNDPGIGTDWPGWCYFLRHAGTADVDTAATHAATSASSLQGRHLATLPAETRHLADHSGVTPGVATDALATLWTPPALLGEPAAVARLNERLSMTLGRTANSRYQVGVVSPLHEFVRAAWAGRKDDLTRGLADPRQVQLAGPQAICYAVARRDREMVALLVQAGVSPDRVVVELHPVGVGSLRRDLPQDAPALFAPLWIALERGDTEMAAFLLEQGANPNAAPAETLPLLHQLCLALKPEAVAFLLGKGANPNLRDRSSGQTSLHCLLQRLVDQPHLLAAQGAPTRRLVTLLTEAGANPDYRTGVGGRDVWELARAVDVLVAQQSGDAVTEEARAARAARSFLPVLLSKWPSPQGRQVTDPLALGTALPAAVAEPSRGIGAYVPETELALTAGIETRVATTASKGVPYHGLVWTDSRHVVAYYLEDGRLERYDLDSMECVKARVLGAPVCACTMSAEGLVVSPSGGGGLLVLDPDSLETRKTVPVGAEVRRLTGRPSSSVVWGAVLRPPKVKDGDADVDLVGVHLGTGKTLFWKRSDLGKLMGAKGAPQQLDWIVDLALAPDGVTLAVLYDKVHRFALGGRGLVYQNTVAAASPRLVWVGREGYSDVPPKNAGKVTVPDALVLSSDGAYLSCAYRDQVMTMDAPKVWTSVRITELYPGLYRVAAKDHVELTDGGAAMSVHLAGTGAKLAPEVVHVKKTGTGLAMGHGCGLIVIGKDEPRRLEVVNSWWEPVATIPLPLLEGETATARNPEFTLGVSASPDGQRFVATYGNSLMRITPTAASVCVAPGVVLAPDHLRLGPWMLAGRPDPARSERDIVVPELGADLYFAPTQNKPQCWRPRNRTFLAIYRAFATAHGGTMPADKIGLETPTPPRGDLLRLSVWLTRGLGVAGKLPEGCEVQIEDLKDADRDDGPLGPKPLPLLARDVGLVLRPPSSQWRGYMEAHRQDLAPKPAKPPQAVPKPDAARQEGASK